MSKEIRRSCFLDFAHAYRTLIKREIINSNFTNMKIAHHFSRFAIVVTVIFSSCSKGEDVENPNATNDINLLNTADWIVSAKHVQHIIQGNLGGSFGTQAFSLQSPNELRWYLWFKHMSGYQDPIEIILNSQNAVVVNKPTGNTGTDFRPFKTIYGGNPGKRISRFPIPIILLCSRTIKILI